ncbi:MAG TPA: zinc ribbon domain-containing protein [Balneolaceae bacterium]
MEAPTLNPSLSHSKNGGDKQGLIKPPKIVILSFMEKKECPSCAVEVDADAEVCPICGYEFPRQSTAVKIAVWVMIALMLIWFFF